MATKLIGQTSAKIQDMKIVGLSGTNGSGKDTVAIMLAERYGFLHVSATDMFIGELNARKWPMDREHKSRLSSEWRRQYGMGVLVDKALGLFNADPQKYKGMVVGSLRHPGEVNRIKELGGIVIWVDAEPTTRYNRIQKSLAQRNQTHSEQGKTFDEFIAEEKKEMQQSGDEATLNMSAVKNLADIFLMNNQDDIEIFKATAEASLKNFLLS